MIYNVVLVSDVQQSESVTHMYSCRYTDTQCDINPNTIQLHMCQSTHVTDRSILLEIKHGGKHTYEKMFNITNYQRNAN